MEDISQHKQEKKNFEYYQKKLKGIQKEYERGSDHNWYLLALTIIFLLFIALVSPWSGWNDFLSKAGFVLLSMSILFYLASRFFRKISVSPIKAAEHAEARINIMKSYYKLHPTKILIVVSSLMILLLLVKFSFGFTRHTFDQAFENLAWFNKDWEITLVYIACLLYTLYDHYSKYKMLDMIQGSYERHVDEIVPA